MIIQFQLNLIDMDQSHDEMFQMINVQNLIYHDLLTIHSNEYVDERPFETKNLILKLFN